MDCLLCKQEHKAAFALTCNIVLYCMFPAELLSGPAVGATAEPVPKQACRGNRRACAGASMLGQPRRLCLGKHAVARAQSINTVSYALVRIELEVETRPSFCWNVLGTGEIEFNFNHLKMPHVRRSNYSPVFRHWRIVGRTNVPHIRPSNYKPVFQLGLKLQGRTNRRHLKMIHTFFGT